MASEEYWIGQREWLLEPELGALSILPIDISEHLNGFTFASANK
jgi:hypothetical protein